MARRMDGSVVVDRGYGMFRRRSRRSLLVGLMATLVTSAVLILYAGPNSALAAAAPPAPMAGIEQLGWMSGHWAGEKDGIAMEEHWTDAVGGGLVGMHKDVKAGKMTSFEFFRIGPGKDGVATYFTQPGGMPAIPFAAVELTPSRVVFENKDHDFPQRILYWLAGDGRLHAKIEGPMKGETVSEEWSWGRVRDGADK